MEKLYLLQNELQKARATALSLDFAMDGDCLLEKERASWLCSVIEDILDKANDMLDEILLEVRK